MKLRNRRLLVAGIVSLAVGLIFIMIGPVLADAGVSSHFEGWWIFGQTVTDVTALYWVGMGITLTGFAVLIIGGLCILLAFVLEALDKSEKSTSTTAI